jgi:hypothetical protein
MTSYFDIFTVALLRFKQFFTMNKYSKIITVILFFCGIYIMAVADRGTFVKKNKARLNIATSGTLKNSIAFNLRSGISYRGSFLLNRQQMGNNLINDAYISYKKGNTIYILPYKQKVVMPEYTQKEGYKLIIRSRK